MNQRVVSLPPAAGMVIQALVGLREVRGIVCFGSYAVGTQDEYSDIDLYVICQPEIASRPERERVLASLDGLQALSLNAGQAGWVNDWCPQEDRLRVGGLAVETTYNTLEWVRTVIAKVREGHISIPEMPFRPYTLLGLLENSLPLYDPDGALEEVYASLRPYPPALKARLIEENLSILADSLAELQDYNRRSIGNRAFHFHLDRALDALELVLFSLNEQYPPATKRVEQVLEKLPRLPRNFRRRYLELLETPLNSAGRLSAAAEVEKLEVEIKEIVETAPPTRSDGLQ